VWSFELQIPNLNPGQDRTHANTPADHRSIGR
jgi:hypothetical protein